MMSAYAWYYSDHRNDTIYWCFSYEMSVTDFAYQVSSMSGISISASDTSYANNDADLQRHLRWMTPIHV